MEELFIRGLRIEWDGAHDEYLRNIDAIKNLKRLEFTSPVTFFTGENGSGKSTLLEAIAVAYGFNPEGGTRNYDFATYDSHSDLCDAMRLMKGCHRPRRDYFLRAESFYNVATKEMEYGGEGRYHEKSHGESFLSMAQNYMGGDGLYLFDEPEAALSPQRQLTLLLEIYENMKKGSQFIIVTHSPILLSLPSAQILTFDDGTVHSCAYEETSTYQTLELFINNREMILKKLLGEK